MAIANTLGAKSGKLPLQLYSTGRAGECDTDKCYAHDTLIYHRGTLGWNPAFICEDCIGDLVEAYVTLVGKDKAKVTLAAALELLKDEEEPTVQSARTTKSKKAAANE